MLWARVLSVAGAVVALDQITKQIAITSIRAGDSREIMFGIEIANIRNRGVAFGLFSDGDLPILAFTLTAIGALLVYFYRHADRPGLWLAVGLLAGGAIANLADRLRAGAVIDFIDFPAWPAFNLADVAIVVGATCLALVLLTREAVDDETGH